MPNNRDELEKQLWQYPKIMVHPHFDVVGELSLSSQSGELRCRCFVSWDIMKPIQDAR